MFRPKKVHPGGGEDGKYGPYAVKGKGTARYVDSMR
jgi:hypothetical protein